MAEQYYSKVYTDRPEYADYDSPEKFQAILGIIMTRLRQHPNAICSYSGGADSDILIDVIERARAILPSLPPVKYVFFNTGLEMKATKDHVKEVAEKYGVEIMEARPVSGKVMLKGSSGSKEEIKCKTALNVVQATRKYEVRHSVCVKNHGGRLR